MVKKMKYIKRKTLLCSLFFTSFLIAGLEKRESLKDQESVTLNDRTEYSINNFDSEFDENYWKDKLTSEQFYITRKGGTERPFSGKYLDNKENGIYVCVCCETELFDSDKKYNSNYFH